MTASTRLPHTYLMDMLRFLKEHAWATGAVGALLMIIHFARIEYLPALSLPDLGLVGGATLAFTLLALFLFLTVFLVPGACYEAWGSARLIPRPEQPRKSARYKHVYSNLMKKRRCPTCGTASRSSASKDIRAGSLSLALIISYVGFGLAIGTYILPLRYASEGIGGALAISFFSASFLLSTLISCLGRSQYTRRLRKSRFGWKSRLLVFTWLLYCAALPIAFLTFSVLPSPESEVGEWGKFLPLLLLPLAHILVYVTSRLSTPARANAVTLLGVYMAVSFGIAFFGIDAAASKLRVGMLRNQTVVLTDRGCNTLIASGIVKACSTTTGDASMLIAGPVDILTRLGSHVVISQPGWTYKHKTVSVPIKAAEVETWFPAIKPDKDVSGDNSAEAKLHPRSSPPASGVRH